jgi:hypothetical protein
MLVGQKWRVPRSAVIYEVERQCGVNLMAISSDDDIANAMAVLETLRHTGLPNVRSGS